MVGPWPLAPHHDHLQYIHHIHLMQRGQKLGCYTIPFHEERFGSTSHIAPSIPVVEATSHVHPKPSVSTHMRIPEPR